MNPFIFFSIIVVFQLSRAFFISHSGKSPKFLWVSFYMVCIPFEEVSKVIGSNSIGNISGTFDSLYRITVPMILCLFLIPLTKFKSIITPQFNHWITFVLLLVVVSVINPYTANVDGPLIFAIFFISHVLLFKLMGNYIEMGEVIKGIFDGFYILSVVQVGLAICFPLLNIRVVTTLFHVEGLEGSTRGGTREGAIGLFSHPGRLALFTLISTSFFLATYLYDYKKRASLMLLFINTIIIVLTFSRTSYIAFIIILILLIFVKKNAKENILSPLNILRIFLPVTAILTWLIFFSPFTTTFTESDAGSQVDNREIHYRMGYGIFKTSPIIGVGLNSHVTYVNQHQDILYNAAKVDLNAKDTDFFIKNPIHNVHIVILAETGIIGFAMWVYFIFGNIVSSKNQIANNQNQILSLTFIGTLLSVSFYGMTGWAPLTNALFPFLLMIAYFSIRYKNSILLKQVFQKRRFGKS